MKSRIPAGERTLYFHMGEDTGELSVIEKALGSLSIPVRRLDASCLEEKLGTLAGPSPAVLCESGAEQEKDFRDALIFCSLTRARLNEALAALKRAQAGEGALKAVLTEHNKAWSMRALLGELEKEDALMNCYQRLHVLVKETAALFEQHPNDRLAAALERAKAALDSASPSLQALQAAEEELRGLSR